RAADPPCTAGRGGCAGAGGPAVRGDQRTTGDRRRDRAAAPRGPLRTGARGPALRRGVRVGAAHLTELWPHPTGQNRPEGISSARFAVPGVPPRRLYAAARLLTAVGYRNHPRPLQRCIDLHAYRRQYRAAYTEP